MSGRIATNVPSLLAQRQLNRTNSELTHNSSKLASGSRIVTAADDAAGLSISTVMNADLRGKRQAMRNSNDAISIVQVAEGAMNELGSMVTRMRELSINAASDTIGVEEREYLDLEVQQLKNEINRIAQSTKWNGNVLLTGDQQNFEIQVDSRNGLDNRISIDSSDLDQSTHALGIYDVRVDSQLQAQFSLEKLDYALKEIGSSRAKLGAYQSRFQSAIQNLSVSDENLSTAKSRIQDEDYAIATSKQVSEKIKQEAATDVLKTANYNGQTVLKLID
ncbi:MAG: flagellin FliC [Bacteriovoracaceae bacterium]|nr:flagellin FliC [Bacteriovoracaceae bacterium]